MSRRIFERFGSGIVVSRALQGKMCKTFVVYSVLLTVNVDVHQRVQHWLHELVGERAEVVVEELDPLEAVEVLEGGGRDVADPKGKKQEQSLFRRMRFIMKRAGKSQKSTAATLNFRGHGPKNMKQKGPFSWRSFLTNFCLLLF